MSYFFSNTSLHGFKFLVVDDAPPWKRLFSRIFWTSCIAISVFFMCVILSSSFKEFSTKTTSINLDTNYRDWNNTFPAVSICMMKGRSTSSIKEHMENYWKAMNQPTPPRVIRFYRAVQGLIFINFHQPLDGINVDACLEINDTCGINLNIMRNILLPRSCQDFMTRVTFLGEEIPCEKIFKLHRTEIGDCFIANNLYSNGKTLENFRQLPLRHSNRAVIERSLEIRYVDNDFVLYKLFIHSPEEFPDGNLEGHGLRRAQAHTYMAFKTTEMTNQKEVKDETISARQCRYPDEYINEEYKLPYSISNCRFYERMRREVKECGCTLPIGEIPQQVPLCNVTSFECVKDISDVDKHGETPCTIPTCLAMEIIQVGQFEEDLEEPVGILVIDIMNNPTLRYVRRVVMTRLDIIGELNDEFMLLENDVKFYSFQFKLAASWDYSLALQF